MENLKTVVYDAMKYVSDTTNDALKAFDVKPVDLHITAPTAAVAAKASGGWVGNPGERGDDRVAAMLGRGEAVLNWGHQKFVDPALRAMYGFGLGEMFHRTRGRHAGADGLGFASGGFVPGLAKRFQRRFAKGGNVWEVRASEELASSGIGWTELSPNGNAAARIGIPHSFSNSQSHYPDFATLGHLYPHGTLLKIRAPNGRSGTWPMTDIGDGSSFAPAIGLTPNVYNALGGMPSTVQITMADGSDIHPFPGMAKLVSGSGGFAAAAAGAGVANAMGVAVQHLKNLKIAGSGALHSIAQAAADKIVSTANKFIDSQTPAPVFGGAAGPGGPTTLTDFKGKPYGSIPAPMQSQYRTGITPQGPEGLGTFEGRQVALWTIPMLEYARHHGWTGPLTSGYRPGNDPGTATGGAGQHAGTQYPNGAVDFGGPDAPGGPAFLNRAAFFRAVAGFKGYQLIPEQFPPYWQYPVGDGGHASGTGHARGGFVWPWKKFAGSYDVGGELPGSQGQPIPIIAHAKEWVVNQGQQKKIASWLGTSRDRLKGALGFSGGPTGFAGGGEPTIGARLGPHGGIQFPNLVDVIGETFPGGVAGWNRIVTQFNAALKKFGTKTANFYATINQLVSQDGIFDQLSAAIDASLTRAQTGLALAQTGLRRVAGRLVSTTGRGRNQRAIRPLTETAADRSAYTIAAANVTALTNERSALATDLQKTNQRIAELRKGGITTKERDVYEQLLGSRNKFLTDLDDADSKIATARSDAFDKNQALVAAQLTAALRPSSQQLLKAQQFARLGAAVGDTDMIARTSDATISALQAQKRILQQRFNAAQNKAKSDPRWQTVADDLLVQLREATASIVEAQATALQNRIDVVNNQAARGQATIDIRNRVADITERMGNPVLAAQQRLAASQAQGPILGRQIAGLNDALATARAEKNTAAIDTLTDQINDLNTQVTELNATISDQTVAVRQATLDQINNRAQFQTGIFGGLGTLVQQVATNLTSDTSAQQATLLQQTAGVLQDQFSQLAQQLSGAFGVNLQGLSGTGFASAVSALNFDSLESGMTTAAKQQFEALIQGLIDTQNALAQNTNQLDTLTGTLGQAQSFSSTAWSLLRMAVFTGAGGLLPQFQVPSMQSGGYVRRAGIFNLHAGEFVVNPSQPGGQQFGGGDVNVTVHEAGPETDYTYLANRIAFATRTPGT